MSKSSVLLINEPPLQVLPSLATAIGLNEAIVVQQVHYWLQHFRKARDTHHYREGRWWVWNSYEEWQSGNFPFWSTDTIQRAFTSAERQGILLSAQLSPDRRDRRKWYTIDYDALNRLDLDDVRDAPPQVAVMDNRKLPSSMTAICHDDSYRDYTETTTESAANAAASPHPPSDVSLSSPKKPKPSQKKTITGKESLQTDTSKLSRAKSAPPEAAEGVQERRAIFGAHVRAVLGVEPDDPRARLFVEHNRGRLNAMAKTWQTAGGTAETFQTDYGNGQPGSGQWYTLPAWLAKDKNGKYTKRPNLDEIEKTAGCLDTFMARPTEPGQARASPGSSPPRYEAEPDLPPSNPGALAEAMRRGLQHARQQS